MRDAIGRRRTAAMRAAGEFWVAMCATCHHPGGLHVIVEWEPRVERCRCCGDCTLYVDAGYGRWSDAQTAEVRAREEDAAR